MNETVLLILKYVFTTMIVGGGLWKGLGAVSKAIDAFSHGMAARSDALGGDHRPPELAASGPAESGVPPSLGRAE